MKPRLPITLLLVLLVAAAPVVAGPISTIFGTAQDASGNPITSGVDIHYTISPGGTGGQAVVASTGVPGLWYPGTPPGPNSWISLAADPHGLTPGAADVVYTYTQAFDLTSYLLNGNLSITGLWSADNWGTMELVNSNGTFLISTLVPGADDGGGSGTFPNFTGVTAFNVVSAVGLANLVQGPNSFVYTITNAYSPDFMEGNATGLRVEFETNADLVPEPATMLLLGCGLAALGLARRRIKA